MEAYDVAAPSGRHWLDPSMFSKADTAALAKFGKNLGRAATGLDGVLTFIDVMNGDISLKQGVAEFGGRWAGGSVGATGAVIAMSFLVAPEIAVPVAVVGGAIGGSKLGQVAVDKLLGY